MRGRAKRQAHICVPVKHLGVKRVERLGCDNWHYHKLERKGEFTLDKRGRDRTPAAAARLSHWCLTPIVPLCAQMRLFAMQSASRPSDALPHPAAPGAPFHLLLQRTRFTFHLLLAATGEFTCALGPQVKRGSCPGGRPRVARPDLIGTENFLAG